MPTSCSRRQRKRSRDRKTRSSKKQHDTKRSRKGRKRDKKEHKRDRKARGSRHASGSRSRRKNKKSKNNKIKKKEKERASGTSSSTSSSSGSSSSNSSASSDSSCRPYPSMRTDARTLKKGIWPRTVNVTLSCIEGSSYPTGECDQLSASQFRVNVAPMITKALLAQLPPGASIGVLSDVEVILDVTVAAEDPPSSPRNVNGFEYTPPLGEVAPRESIVSAAKKLGEPAELLQRNLRNQFCREDICVNLCAPHTIFDDMVTPEFEFGANLEPIPQIDDLDAMHVCDSQSSSQPQQLDQSLLTQPPQAPQPDQMFQVSQQQQVSANGLANVNGNVDGNQNANSNLNATAHGTTMVGTMYDGGYNNNLTGAGDFGNGHVGNDYANEFVSKELEYPPQEYQNDAVMDVENMLQGLSPFEQAQACSNAAQRAVQAANSAMHAANCATAMNNALLHTQTLTQPGGHHDFAEATPMSSFQQQHHPQQKQNLTVSQSHPDFYTPTSTRGSQTPHMIPGFPSNCDMLAPPDMPPSLQDVVQHANPNGNSSILPKHISTLKSVCNSQGGMQQHTLGDSAKAGVTPKNVTFLNNSKPATPMNMKITTGAIDFEDI